MPVAVMVTIAAACQPSWVLAACDLAAGGIAFRHGAVPEADTGTSPSCPAVKSVPNQPLG